ncbi:MAG: ABC transporter ATP-binding protein [Deltaproteobacteria bacterium]|nr:ABC transporter ATP-binding protein [Candidatus Anaeroferrophillus wilburensis]MBN2888068.1 ABC transporter ATP-binding protein [Deltaproteobacteria bacterium]
MVKPAIVIQQLSKTYGSIKALAGVDLQVEQGELFALLGPNGAGKTTMVRIMTGLTRADAGRVFINGINAGEQPIAAKRQVGLVPQMTNLDSELTVYQNLDLHGRFFAMGRRQRRQRIEELLAYVELGDRLQTPVKNLSGGMKRRLLIIRAMMHNPTILFMDEPTVGLDAAIRRRIWSIIRRIQNEGTTILLTTHYIEEAEYLAARVAFVDRGEVVAVDRPASLVQQKGRWVVDRLVDNELQSQFFLDHEAAQAAAAAVSGGVTIRRVNLEDVFLDLTGRKVAES